MSEIADAYEELYETERGFRDVKAHDRRLELPHLVPWVPPSASSRDAANSLPGTGDPPTPAPALSREVPPRSIVLPSRNRRP